MRRRCVGFRVLDCACGIAGVEGRIPTDQPINQAMKMTSEVGMGNGDELYM